MEDVHVTSAEKPARGPPWNKGKIVGAKPPLRPSHVWSIRIKLQIEGRKRDLALFNLGVRQQAARLRSARYPRR
jgi:hypothetical protein